MGPGLRWKTLLAVWTLCACSGVAPAQASGARGSAATQQALALEQRGAWKDAEAAWRQVMEQNPRDAMAMAHLGLALARETDYAGAAEEYRRALRLDPRMPGVQLDLGLARCV